MNYVLAFKTIPRKSNFGFKCLLAIPVSHPPSGALKVKNIVLMADFVGRNHGLILNSSEGFKSLMARITSWR